MLINQAKVKRRAFELLAEHRPYLAEKMTRLSGDFMPYVDRKLDEVLTGIILSAPTTGKTLSPAGMR